jgi:hypothetical protein
MIQVHNLRRVGNQPPQEFELTFKDLENKNEGYYQTIVYGTEPYLREALRNSRLVGDGWG